MLSIWAPPVMTADELARIPGHAGSGQEVTAAAIPADPEP